MYPIIIALLTFLRHNALKYTRQRDGDKQHICYNSGITLIVIPFWWNHTMESLTKTIYLARPDILFPDDLLRSDPISPQMPKQVPTAGKCLIHRKSKAQGPQLCPKTVPDVSQAFDLQTWWMTHAS